MYLSIVFLPFFSFLGAALFGWRIGIEGSKRITSFFIGLTFLLSSFSFFENGLLGSLTNLKGILWIDSDLFYCNWGFLFDSLTVTMLIVVTSVSSLVHLYSTEYMSGDPHLSRFMSYLSLFTFFMLILVTGDNFLQLFVGWEGVGLCSYLLINFWFTRLQANKAAIKAMIINRIGDFGLALGIFGLFTFFKALNYETIFPMVSSLLEKEIIFLNIRFDSYTIIGLLLFIGSVGKSAQLGLHTWLPDAMEGPTPVSALIHAATMVTAGVFLLARSSPFFEYTPISLMIITIIGAMTAFFGSSTGLLQNDLKRVIAYSTCSQLGYMIFACGLSNYSVGIFHLVNHAFFKALLFLSAGSIIHAMGDEQDIRKMGGLRRLLPFSYGMVIIGSLALMGFPFLTGFYSKDLILELAFSKYTFSGHFAHWLGSLGAFFTAFYSFRLIFLTFLSQNNSFRKLIIEAHDPPLAMSIGLGLLAIGSIFTGYYIKDMFVGLGTDFWGKAIYTLPKNINILEAEFIPLSIKHIPLFFSISGAFSSYLLYTYFSRELYDLKISKTGRGIYTFLNRKWFFDKIYNECITQKSLEISFHSTYKIIDRGLIEILGPYGIVSSLFRGSQKIANLQSGYLFHYAFYIFLGLSFFFYIKIIKMVNIKIYAYIFLFYCFFLKIKKSIKVNNRK